MAEDLTIWNYIEGLESPEEYEAFEWYRDSAPALRSIASVARALSISQGTAYAWAGRNMWAERVRYYDEHRIAERTRLRELAEAQADITWAEKRGLLIGRGYEICQTALEQLLRDLQTRRTRMRPNEIKQLTDLILKFGNLANGDATEKIDGIPDYSKLTDDQLAALETLRGLAAKDEET